ncbi:MAG: ATP-binding protein [Rubrivivax sp.]|nr:ATP-binding protein [Rubrivivax sp.]
MTASSKPRTTPRAAPLEAGSGDSAFEASAFERSLGGEGPTPRIGSRRPALVLAALVGCIAVFSFVRWLATTPQLDATWAAGPLGELILVASPDATLDAHRGQGLVALGTPAQEARPVDAALLHRSPRWQVDDAARRHLVAQHEALAAQLAQGRVGLQFDDGTAITVPTPARGFAGLGATFWPLAGLALLLYLFGVVVVMARPRLSNALFAVMALCQAGNLLFIALENLRGLGLPPGMPAVDLPIRVALDLCTGAAAVHAFALHPLRLPRATTMAAAAWAGAALWLVGVLLVQPAHLWWWAQGACIALAAAALAVIARSQQRQPNPYALVMRRFAGIALATLVLTTLAVAVIARIPAATPGVATGASAAWHLFLASLLLLVPFLARSRQLLREFALLAGISTVATSLDLMFVALFSLGPFTSLAVAVFVALGLYAAGRQWILNHLIGSTVLSTERTFDQLYRAAREVQARPERYPQMLGQLLRELFDPLEMRSLDRLPTRSLVVGSGSALVVPLRPMDAAGTPACALALRFAQHGRRLFTLDDARLADRIVEQLRRAVAYDQAVEQGRVEERLRIAQDLHDDIGARLLTLMYQAQSPEMEDYIRHTLQDLKTLTRGLAAAEHRLSYAAAEWKADLTQRLTVAQVELGWSFSHDRDLRLSVVQWSALTRVLRELVTNALYHGAATRIDVSLVFEGPRLTLEITDDGRGRAPQAWAHGLGMGGVRKRVKLMGGEVQWRENSPRGIVCTVRVDTTPTVAP